MSLKSFPSRGDFLKYLASKGARLYFSTVDPDKGALSKFLLHKTGKRYRVSASGYGLTAKGGGTAKVPTWAVEFINKSSELGTKWVSVGDCAAIVEGREVSVRKSPTQLAA